MAISDLARLLNAKRGSRGVRAAALEAGISAATFSRVERGHMPDLETFAKLCKWLERDPRDFLDIEHVESEEKPAAVGHFKKKKTVSMETANALGELILAAQRSHRARQNLLGS
jgi:transcriptional regulator with XRE-family HTH domain